ncbi:pentapeptide repeat-containing protein [Alkalispirochaeta alkalica]|uniref:pentapeptide repeat-containing protein n=1 Tax=Alkalispirochaeta alkalica TaxID=46356 RepID=UPI00037D3145|nr:pentapeptide repeat-containing protein [Alkalispirochaeta alkalica]
MSVFPARSLPVLLQEWERARGAAAGWQIISNDISGSSFVRGDWKDTSFRESVLNEADFSSGGFRDCEFFRCSMQRLLLDGARMIETALDACVLTRAVFQGVRADQGIIRRCILNSTDARDARFNSCLLEDLESWKTRFDGAIFYRCRFCVSPEEGVAGFHQASFRKVLFIQCSFEGEVFREGTLEGAFFIQCSFNRQSWEYAEWQDALFWECQGSPPVSCEFPRYGREISMNGKKAELLTALADLDAESLRDALAMILTEESQEPAEERGLREETPDSLGRDIAEASDFPSLFRLLKTRLNMKELDHFTVDSGSVWVTIGSRKHEITSGEAKSPVRRAPEAGSVAPPRPATGDAPGRFGNLEL